MRDETLWARLQAYAFPMSDRRSLSAQIAAETVLDAERAALAVTEYRKFLYLVATSDGILAPSPLIDSIWHLHLMDTKAYFEVFCPQVLGKTLHHIPGRPPARSDRAYLETLAQYQTEFGEVAPHKIWPTPGSMRNTATAQAWVTLLALVAIGCAFAESFLFATMLGLGAAILAVWAFTQSSWAFGAPGDSSSGCGGGSSSDTSGGDGGCGGGD